MAPGLRHAPSVQKAVVPLMLVALVAGGALCVLAPAPVLATVAAVELAADPCNALSGPSASGGPDAAVEFAPAR